MVNHGLQKNNANLQHMKIAYNSNFLSTFPSFVGIQLYLIIHWLAAYGYSGQVE